MMKRTAYLLAMLLLTFSLSAQEDTTGQKYLNTAAQMLMSKGKLGIGGYGEVHFNRTLSNETSQAATLDVHRLVMFLGYNFSDRTKFVSEIEFEYAKELWVEQAFLQHKLNGFMNFRAGLLLVPMGIINEYHEPVSFHGVERPLIDNRISLTTWREIGAGFSGTILPAKMNYQLYVMSGLNGYDSQGIFSGSKGLREGRQKGSKAYATSPVFAGRLEFFGIRNLTLGLSAYSGKSQSRLYAGLHRDSTDLRNSADSSRIGIGMLGADARYGWKALELRGQFYYTRLSGTAKYNQFTQAAGKPNDLGSAMIGYYAEAAYNVLHHVRKTRYALLPFVRYEFYNMHHKVESLTAREDAYENVIITSGLSLKLHQNAVVKADLELRKSKADKDWTKIINAGIGVNF